MIENKEELFLTSIEDETVHGARTIAGLAVILFPLFTVLDYLTQREHYQTLSIIRFSVTLFFLAAWLMLRKGLGFKKAFYNVLVLMTVASSSITLMCMVLQGPSSPYYAGVNLVVLSSVLILTVSAVDMTKCVLLIIGIYMVGVLSVTDSFQDHWRSFVNNMFFLFSTGIIGVTASHFKNRLRRRAFYQGLEINRSMVVLINELEGKSDATGIEGLAQEMVDKKLEVQNALSVRDGFISMASHELRTPLTSMKLQMDLVKIKLNQGTHSSEDVMKHVLNAYRQITNIVHLVDEMLDVSRIQSGKFLVEKQDFDLGELVKQIIDSNYSDRTHMGKVLLQSHNVSLKGHWDPFKIEQVIINLINNAFRYGGDTEVTITTGREGQFAFVTVTDKGPGISSEEQAKIFDKFERGKDTRGGGLGLGLFISKQIATHHGGSLSVTSEQGKGSSFTLQLPL